MAEHGKKCYKCDKLFRVKEWFIIINDKEEWCKPCIQDKVRCGSCFQSPEIRDNNQKDIDELGDEQIALKK